MSTPRPDDFGDRVPQALRELKQWVLWRYDPARTPGSKPSKVPYSTNNNGKASTSDPSTWGSFDEADGAWQFSQTYDGVGFVFTEQDPFVGIDLDDSLEPGTRILKPWAKDIVDSLDSYTEVSPSGKGVKVFVRADKPARGRKTQSGDGAVEVYGTGRYFTVTGDHLQGTPSIVESRNEQVLALIEQYFPEPVQPVHQSGASLAHQADTGSVAITERERRCRAYLSKCEDAISGQGGHDKTLHAACECFRFGLDDASVWSVMRWFNENKTGSERWSDKELEHKIESAMQKVQAEGGVGSRLGQAPVSPRQRAAPPPAPPPGHGVDEMPALEPLEQEDDSIKTGGLEYGVQGSVELGKLDPETDRLVLSPQKTLPTANAFIREFYGHPEAARLVCHAGVLMEWRDNRNVEIPDDMVRHRLQGWLHNALRYQHNKKLDKYELVPFDSNSSTIKSALEAIRDRTALSADTPIPSWLDPCDNDPAPEDLLAFPNSTLDIRTNRVLAPTPRLFNINARTFDYDPDASIPVRWLAFLKQLFEDDTQSVELIQEWMGYSLVSDTSQQKMLLMVGPKRSGKGTIGRILKHLVGVTNIAGPTTSSLAGAFGLQPLMGKTLAIVSDARFSGDGISTVIERLLCISGEDTLSIDRKYFGSVSMKLPTRFMFLTNELPRLTDASGALASRFLVLRFTRSFYGRENTELDDQLKAELPGILLWAIEGLKRLRARGRFVQPESSRQIMQDMEDLSSPISAFIREMCVVKANQRVSVDDLYMAWKSWCDRDGRVTVSNKQVFGRDLNAAAPGVTRHRGTGNVTYYSGISLKELSQ